MALVHKLNIELFARTPDGQEFPVGTVEIPITIDIPRPATGMTHREPKLAGPARPAGR